MMALPKIKKTFRSGDRRFDLDVRELDIALGEITYLVGPNGCGKSLYLNSLLEILDQTKRQDPRGSKNSKHGSGRVILIKQSPDANISNALTVIENVALWAKPNGLSDFLFPTRKLRSSVVAWEARFPSLAGVWNQETNTLSGGQKQAVVLLSRLMANPNLLLLDEVLSAVDQKLAPDLLTYITNRVRELGCATLSVSHDLAGVSKKADRVLVMSNGKLSADLHRDSELDHQKGSLTLLQAITAVWPS